MVLEDELRQLALVGIPGFDVVVGQAGVGLVDGEGVAVRASATPS